MSFWKKWWKKKNKDKAGAEFEDLPLPAEVDEEQNEKVRRQRRNNLSMSRSGRMKSKARERSQLSTDLFHSNGNRASGAPDGENNDKAFSSSQGDGSATGTPTSSRKDSDAANGSFGKNSCREAQQQLMAQHQSMPAATIH